MQTPALSERDLAILRAVFVRFPCVREARVFGSRANGTARRASDIDLAISAPNAKIEEWLELKAAIEETPIIYELDIVRVEKAENLRLLEKIEREGLVIFQQDAPIAAGN